MKNQVYANRELSWIQFNERVLEEAVRERVPLCERLSFLSICQSNLDEFFMVRVGSLVDQMTLDEELRENKTNLSAREQLAAIMENVRRLNSRKEDIYAELMGKMEENQIRLVDFHKLTVEQSEELEHYFDQKIALLLSPAIVGKRQPFPFLRNSEIYAVAALRKKPGKNGKSGGIKMGIISCWANVISRLIPVPAEPGTYMLAEELILHCIDRVFRNYTVVAKSLIRLTRNADIDADALYDEDWDYREFMAKLIKQRRRLTPVRMEMSRELGTELVERLCRELDVDRNAVFRSSIPLDLSFLYQFQDLLRGREWLFYPRRVPQKATQFHGDRPILEQVREGDKLLAYPYDSMQPFIRMLREAASDDEVISIRMTLYRMAKHSQVVESLIEAAENGKDVQVLVELKARFDEENNIEWSRRLENAGCQVIYGLNGYKVHSKLCLITRRTAGEPEYFTQIGTGNYNEKTARQYTDFVLLTHAPEIGANAAEVFQALALGETVAESRRLLVAPQCLQNRIIHLIDAEIAHARQGEAAYIGIKINSLTDKRIMDRFIAASCAGVKIDLVVRGICCLIPGIPGKTENIRVISIVGRFLEHSRIYLFGPPEREKIYISSADFMTRNTLRRVEVAAPVDAPDLRQQIRYMFHTMLQDNQQAWELQADGTYCRVKDTGPPINSQEHFFWLVYERAGQPLPKAAERPKNSMKT